MYLSVMIGVEFSIHENFFFFKKQSSAIQEIRWTYSQTNLELEYLD